MKKNMQKIVDLYKFTKTYEEQIVRLSQGREPFCTTEGLELKPRWLYGNLPLLLCLNVYLLGGGAVQGLPVIYYFLSQM